MKRRLRNLMTAVSLVLCVAVVALGVHARWWHGVALLGVGDRVYHVGALTRGFYACEFGGITDEYLRDHPVREHWYWVQAKTPELMTDTADQVGLGFAAFRHFYSPPHSYVSHSAVLIPYWAPACLFALLPAAGLVRRARRYPAGHCHRCGYDLRASPERCPECGTSR